MARQHLTTGTSARRALDMSRLAKAVARPGIDPRLWVSHGTVGTVDDAGNPDYTDWHAIHVAPRGVVVDVVLQPSMIPATCSYLGIQGGGAATMYAPIRPGDQVLVVLPDGDTVGPKIVAILNSTVDPLPVDPDGKPTFRNDRVLLEAADVPVDLRTRGGARVLIEQDGRVTASGTKVVAATDDTRIGAADAPEQLLLGTTYRSAQGTLDDAWQTILDALTAYATAIQAVADPGNVATPPLLAAITAMQVALAAFESSPYLSTVARTK